MKFQNPSMHGSLDMTCIRFHSDFFQRGITPEREITWSRKTTRVSYFSMRNPYMKFQNPSTQPHTVHKIWHTCFEWTHAQTTQNQHAPSTSSKLGA